MMGLFNLKQRINEQISDQSGNRLSDQQLHDLHAFLVNMLCDIISVCEKYDLIYFMGGGSCLGTIRHKGFIPWDDDLDINMPRKDYEIFTTVFQKELGDRYILNAPNYSRTVIGRFPKILAKNTEYVQKGFSLCPYFDKVFIDIFVMENVPDNKIERYLKGIYVNILEFAAGQVFIHNVGNKNKKQMQQMIGSANYHFRNILGSIFSLKSYTEWCNLIDRRVRHDNDASSYICFPTGRKHYFGEIIERKTIFPLEKALFESVKVNVPGCYQLYLSNLYGNDYMTLPPENKRERHFVVSLKMEDTDAKST